MTKMNRQYSMKVARILRDLGGDTRQEVAVYRDVSRMLVEGFSYNQIKIFIKDKENMIKRRVYRAFDEAKNG